LHKIKNKKAKKHLWRFGVLVAVTRASFVVWAVALCIAVNTDISEDRAPPTFTLHLHSLPWRPTHHIPSKRGC